MTQEKRNRPAFNIWYVPEREGAKWIQLGVVWPNQNGEGFNGSLDVAPMGSGRIVMLPPKAREDDTD
jgi:hypothetical protein